MLQNLNVSKLIKSFKKCIIQTAKNLAFMITKTSNNSTVRIKSIAKKQKYI